MYMNMSIVALILCTGDLSRATEQSCLVQS